MNDTLEQLKKAIESSNLTQHGLNAINRKLRQCISIAGDKAHQIEKKSPKKPAEGKNADQR